MFIHVKDCLGFVLNFVVLRMIFQKFFDALFCIVYSNVVAPQRYLILPEEYFYVKLGLQFLLLLFYFVIENRIIIFPQINP
jgi:hypothetical protein